MEGEGGEEDGGWTKVRRRKGKEKVGEETRHNDGGVGNPKHGDGENPRQGGMSNEGGSNNATEDGSFRRQEYIR